MTIRQLAQTTGVNYRTLLHRAKALGWDTSRKTRETWLQLSDEDAELLLEKLPRTAPAQKTPKEISWQTALELVQAGRISVPMAEWCLKESSHTQEEILAWRRLIIDKTEH